MNVQESSLTLSGVNVANYTFSGFSYNAATDVAKWTLSSPISSDRLSLDLHSTGPNAVTNAAGKPLDGDWTNGSSSYPSGNGVIGGDFNFGINVLPGDTNQDGIVNSQDLALIASNWLTAGPAGDVNGDGIINAQDLALLSSNWLATLPAGSAQAIASVTGADSVAPVATTSTTGQSTPATARASAVAVNSVVSASAMSLSVGASSPVATSVAGRSALKNADLTVSPSSFVGPLQPDHVAAFIGRIDALPNTNSIDRVLSQAAGAGVIVSARRHGPASCHSSNRSRPPARTTQGAMRPNRRPRASHGVRRSTTTCW